MVFSGIAGGMKDCAPGRCPILTEVWDVLCGDSQEKWELVDGQKQRLTNGGVLSFWILVGPTYPEEIPTVMGTRVPETFVVFPSVFLERCVILQWEVNVIQVYPWCSWWAELILSAWQRNSSLH